MLLRLLLITCNWLIEATGNHRFGVRFTEIVTTRVLFNEIFWSLRKTIHITIRIKKNYQTNSLSWSVEDAERTWMRIASVAVAFYCP